MPRSPASRIPLALLLGVLGALALAGCGTGSSEGAGGGGGPLVDWPMFGRVPERTHYLPGEGRILNPPLHEAWSINTHALIEFPPAIANRVAYVVNKYATRAPSASATTGSSGNGWSTKSSPGRRSSSPPPSTAAAASTSPT